MELHKNCRVLPIAGSLALLDASSSQRSPASVFLNPFKEPFQEINKPDVTQANSITQKNILRHKPLCVGWAKQFILPCPRKVIAGLPTRSPLEIGCRTRCFLSSLSVGGVWLAYLSDYHDEGGIWRWAKERD